MNATVELDEIRIVPMRRGACPVCAARHKPEDGHDKRSLRYIMRLLRRPEKSDDA